MKYAIPIALGILLVLVLAFLVLFSSRSSRAQRKAEAAWGQPQQVAPGADGRLPDLTERWASVPQDPPVRSMPPSAPGMPPISEVDLAAVAPVSPMAPPAPSAPLSPPSPETIESAELAEAADEAESGMPPAWPVSVQQTVPGVPGFAEAMPGPAAGEVDADEAAGDAPGGTAIGQAPGVDQGVPGGETPEPVDDAAQDADAARDADAAQDTDAARDADAADTGTVAGGPRPWSPPPPPAPPGYAFDGPSAPPPQVLEEEPWAPTEPALDRWAPPRSVEALPPVGAEAAEASETAHLAATASEPLLADGSEPPPAAVSEGADMQDGQRASASAQPDGQDGDAALEFLASPTSVGPVSPQPVPPVPPISPWAPPGAVGPLEALPPEPSPPPWQSAPDMLTEAEMSERLAAAADYRDEVFAPPVVEEPVEPVEPVDEPELVVVDEPVDEPEPVEPDRPEAVEPRVVVVDAPMDELEAVEEPEPIEAATADGPEPTEAPWAAAVDEVEEAGPVDDLDPLVEAAEPEAVAVDEPELVEAIEPEQVVVNELVEEAEPVEDLEAWADEAGVDAAEPESAAELEPQQSDEPEPESSVFADPAPVPPGEGRRISSIEEIRDGGYGVGSAAPFADGAQPLGHPVQAYRDTMTYRAPGQPGYDDREPDVWFYDESAAERCGFRPAQD